MTQIVNSWSEQIERKKRKRGRSKWRGGDVTVTSYADGEMVEVKLLSWRGRLKKRLAKGRS